MRHGDGEWTDLHDQDDLTTLAKRLADDPLLMLCLTAWEVESNIRGAAVDTDGPVGEALRPVVAMLSKLVAS